MNFFFPPTENAGSKSEGFFLFCFYFVGFHGRGPFRRHESLRSHPGLSAGLQLPPVTTAADMGRSQKAGRRRRRVSSRWRRALQLGTASWPASLCHSAHGLVF